MNLLAPTLLAIVRQIILCPLGWAINGGLWLAFNQDNLNNPSMPSLVVLGILLALPLLAAICDVVSSTYTAFANN
jgi:uncharacterized membrane protein (DUF485 family)